jgi:hypothetical protein
MKFKYNWDTASYSIMSLMGASNRELGRRREG